MTNLSARALRVAMSGVVSADDPHIIADLQDKSESDAKVIAALREALTGIAEYCSGDGQPIGAIDRLVAIRNTAQRALAAANEQTADK